MGNIRGQIVDILNKYSEEVYTSGSCGELGESFQALDSSIFYQVSEEICGNISSQNCDLMLKENDFDSTLVEKGYHYLCKLKSGTYQEVWYNYHGQWMVNHPDGEKVIDKIYTPKIR